MDSLTTFNLDFGEDRRAASRAVGSKGKLVVLTNFISTQNGKIG